MAAPTRVMLYSPHVKESISLMSSEAESPNYRGFLNLGGIIIIVANFRLIIENILKYGFLLKLPSPFEFYHHYSGWPCLSTAILLIIPLAFSYYIETKLAQKYPPGLIKLLNFLNICATLIAPPYIVFLTEAYPLPASALLSVSLICAMKLYSFSDVMSEVRLCYKNKEYEKFPSEIKEVIAKYPNICSIKHFAYFIAAPTLCFQFTYPRSPSIRKAWLFKRIAEWILALSFMVILIQQYMMPLIQNTLPIINNVPINYTALLERHLKLSLPNLYFWLIMFFSAFQCFTNILAELTRFADRTFYKEWWNSRTLGEYWKLWNIPVHSWLLRHVHFPLINLGFHKHFAMFVTFFISAVGHEYVISGACRIVSYWAFTAMMMQIPLIIVMDIFKSFLLKTQIGNVVFWVSFCIIGQPLAVLIYSIQVINRMNP